MTKIRQWETKICWDYKLKPGVTFSYTLVRSFFLPFFSFTISFFFRTLNIFSFIWLYFYLLCLFYLYQMVAQIHICEVIHTCAHHIASYHLIRVCTMLHIMIISNIYIKTFILLRDRNLEKSNPKKLYIFSLKPIKFRIQNITITFQLF